MKQYIIALVAVLAVAPTAMGLEADAPSGLLLVTLDTTRGDVIGCAGGDAATPVLDGLAARGTRFARAIAPTPLTLPSHTSLLTGLDPPQHGVRTNGADVLQTTIPTLATVLGSDGVATAAVVGSRVLDRRFGLGRGFAVYDDLMLAERQGQYGYPERDAVAVTGRAIEWLRGLEPGQRWFLWVHYYDPHAPYAPPGSSPGDDPQSRYRGEVEVVDRQLGRLLAALPGTAANRVVAVVGDHGEALGEHGEEFHGLFLYEGVLHVPMIVAGGAVPAGRVEPGPTAIVRLAPALLQLMGVDPPEGMAPPLAIVSPDTGEASREVLPVYSETRFPAAVYGWAPLAAITTGTWRYIHAPRPELYDLGTDPGEARNLVGSKPEVAQRLRSELDRLAEREAVAAPESAALDAELRAALEALGYVSGGETGVGDDIDPKDGIVLLGQLDAAAAELGAGRSAAAITRLRALVTRNPSNITFRSRLAAALAASGDREAAVAEYREAVQRSPRSEFLRLRLAHAERLAGRPEAASASAREALDLDRRFAPAWLLLVELAEDDEARLGVLHEALDAGVDSVVVLRAAARLEPDPAAAEAHLSRAVQLAPEDTAVKREWGEAAERRGDLDEAAERLRRAVELDPTDAPTTLALGRVLLRLEDSSARGHLMRAKVLGRGTPVAEDAQRLLEAPPETP